MSQFIEVKTVDLIGPALDWAVGNADGRNVWLGEATVNGRPMVCEDSAREMYWYPSMSWSHGGPLIEMHRVCLLYRTVRPATRVEPEDWVWLATLDPYADCDDLYNGEIGPSPLIAACRAIVAAKLGDVVSVPAELVIT